MIVCRGIPALAAFEVLADRVEWAPNSDPIPASFKRVFIHLEIVMGETAFRVEGEIRSFISVPLNFSVTLL